MLCYSLWLLGGISRSVIIKDTSFSWSLFPCAPSTLLCPEGRQKFKIHFKTLKSKQDKLGPTTQKENQVLQQRIVQGYSCKDGTSFSVSLLLAPTAGKRVMTHLFSQAYCFQILIITSVRYWFGTAATECTSQPHLGMEHQHEVVNYFFTSVCSAKAWP